jgi:glycosyltransferase involved in cell wall biosynthesis
MTPMPTALRDQPKTHPPGDTGAVRPLHVAVVDEELPYPMTSGKRLRTLNLLLRLAGRHRVTYLCHRNADAAEARLAATFLRDHGITPVVVDRAVPPRRGPAFYARLAANLLSPLPYSVASHTSRALRQALREHAATHPVDLWQCEWTPYAEVLRGLSAPQLVIAHNVESLIWQRYHDTETNPLKRWYIRRQWRKFERFERRTFAEAAGTVAVSPDDARRLQQQFAARNVSVVDNGVDTGYFRPQETPREPAQVLFLGSLDWRPNLDGVGLLAERVFPAVRRSLPGARLCVVGRNPPDWLRRLVAALPGAELHGSVADVRPHLARSSVLAVPLRIGGGSRLKILEALASGLPVVSTRVGAEGLCLEPERHLTVVEGVDDMGAALVRCLNQPREMRAQAERGRRVVLERYDWDRLAERLEQVWIGTAVRELEVTRRPGAAPSSADSTRGFIQATHKGLTAECLVEPLGGEPNKAPGEVFGTRGAGGGS